MTLDWEALGKGALYVGLPLAGFLVGGGWPWKAVRRMGDLDLRSRLESVFVTIAKFEAYVREARLELEAYMREERMRSDRQDEILDMLASQQKATLSLAGAVERNSEAIKFLAEDILEVRRDVSDLRDLRRPPEPHS